MGQMDLSDFRDELSFVLKGRADTALSTARLNQIINQAYSHLCQPEVRKHKELLARYDFSLVSGTNEYSLSTATVGYDVLGVKDVTCYEAASITATATRRDVVPRDLNWFNKRTLSSGGLPSVYALDGDWLVLYPVPSATENGYQMRVTVWREPTLLTTDDQKTVLGNYWDRVLLRGAQWLLEYDLGLRELAVLTKQEYVSLINEKADDYQLNSDDDSFAVEIKNESSMPR